MDCQLLQNRNVILLMTPYVTLCFVILSPLYSIYGYAFSWSGLLCFVLSSLFSFREIRRLTRIWEAILLIGHIQVQEPSRQPWRQARHHLMQLAFRRLAKDRILPSRKVLIDPEDMAAFNNGRLSSGLTRSLPRHEMDSEMDRARLSLETPFPTALLPIAEISGVIQLLTLGNATLALQCLEVKL